MPTHSKHARTHDESRKAVCCVCGKKPKTFQTRKPITVVNDKQSSSVRKFVFSEYNVNNPQHPTALCLPCNTALVAYEKVIKINIV